jgi:fido (protein-threonine AMPylation protein)
MMGGLVHLIKQNPMVLTWEPIADLPQDWSGLTDGELGPLLQFWNDQRADLEQSGALAEFNTRLGREWSIETGQIEGVYNLDRGLTETLIERGIDSDLIPNQPGQKPPEIIAAIIQDHAEVLEGLFQFVKGDRPLSKSYIHELHAALLRHQDTTAVRDQFGNLFEARLIKGKYKERPNNPKKPDGSMHQYCPPEHVESEMERLLALHEEHEKKRVPVEVAAAWLHHRFTQIHPYQDGNGRVARALASLLFIKAGWFPVVVTREDRARYIDGLEVADEGDLRSFVSFSIHLQKKVLFELVQSAAELRKIDTVADAITAAKNSLKSLGTQNEPVIWPKTIETANHLIDSSHKRLIEVATALKTAVTETSADLRFRVEQHGHNELLLKNLPYDANRKDFQRGVSLEIFNPISNNYATIEIQAHAVGSKFRGLMAIMAAFEDKQGHVSGASREPFQVNYAESYESAERRFRPWLEESLVNALTLWRKSL